MTAAVPTPDQPATGQGQPNAEPNPEADKPLGEGGEKALRAERSRANAAEKLVSDLQAQVKEFQDKGKSAEDKQADHVATLTSERDTATVKALRYEVCDEMELPLKSARFLTGSTKAEIEEAAKAFKELVGGTKPTEKPATGLPESPNAGREAHKLSGAEAGLAKARERFPELAKK
jgi:hypothetical protein